MGTDNVNKEIEENFETKKYVPTNKELYKIIEAINEKNENNIEKISNAFLKAIKDIKLGKNNSSLNENHNNNIINEGTSNINNVPFHIKDFHLTSINFNQWYTPLVHHLISCDLLKYIEIKKEVNSMNQIEIKLDNKTQSIIEASLDRDRNDVLKRCKTAFEMMNRLKERYYQTGQTFIDNIDKQIKDLKIIKNDFLSYIHKMDELYNLRKNECEKLNKDTFDDNYKIVQMYRKLTKLNINPLLLLLIDCHSYEEWKAKIVQKGKLPYNFHKDKNKDKTEHKVHIEDNFCYICEIYRHNTKNCFKLKENKEILKIIKQLKKGKESLNSEVKSCNINNKNFNSSDKDSDSDETKSLNFTSNYVTCSLSKNNDITKVVNKCNNCKNCDNKSEKNTDKDNSTFTKWIIDSGTAINLIGNLNKLSNINEIEYNKITYANGTSEYIKDIGTYT
ncbi:hypothetical protein PIROE2DRAFT_19324, partial [Piromyces sp. E2]